MKTTAKIVAAALLCAVLFTSCSKQEKTPEGYDLVQNAKTLYAELDSAHVRVINNDANIITQDFMFKYDGETFMYRYIGTDGDKIYYEYNDGENLYYTDSDSTEWITVPKGDESYITYTRENPHPLASAEAITVSGSSIKTDAITKSEDGSAAVLYIYDAEKMSSVGLTADGSGVLKEFQTRAELAPDGYCTRVTQVAVIEDSEGKFETNYTIEFTQMNQTDSIERPKACWES